MKNAFCCSILLLLAVVHASSPLCADEVITGLSEDESSQLENPVVIGLGTHQINDGDLSKLQRAYGYIFSRISPTDSEYLLYPEYFLFRNDDGAETPFISGAIFKMTDEGLEGIDDFDFFRSTATVNLGQAKALYDGHIAILDLEKVIDGKNRHLTFEADAYCNVLHTYIGKHERCFRGFSDYEEYLEDDEIEDKEQTSIIFMHAEDIQNGKLQADGLPFFRLLILPDLTFGLEDEILEELGSEGIAKICEFVSSGGTVFSSGKSAYLLEKMGLIANGTVNSDIIVKNYANHGKIIWNNNDDFQSRLFSLGIVPEDDGDLETYFLSGFLVDSSKDPGLTEIACFDFNSDQNFYWQDSQTLEKISQPAGSMTALAWKDFSNGEVLLTTGHPASSNSRYFSQVFNAVFSAFAKEISADLKVVQKVNPDLADNVIPALESNVRLSAGFVVQNFFDQPVSQVRLEINVAKGFEASEFDNCTECNCHLGTADPEYSQKIECECDKIAKFEKKMVEFPIEITDPSVTQKKTRILAANGHVEYITHDGKTENVNAGSQHLTAYRGAEIRAEYNPDPSSFYPLKGEGVFIDNVLTAENKEDTNAEEVEHISVVPLISPVVDGNDQASLVYTIEFFNEYYQTYKKYFEDNHGIDNAFIFPYKNADADLRDYDFVDYKTLKCTDAVLSADWDTPVKTILMSRSEVDLPPADNCTERQIDDIIGKDYAYSVNNECLVSKQLYFADADNYYEHATQRQLVFVDTTKEKGAQSFYKDGIPQELQNGTVAKKNLIFARNDIYFYDNKNYPLPEGVSDPNIFFTIDRFEGLSCGDGSGIISAGYFDHELPGGVQANEYENKLICKLGKTPIDVTRIEDYTDGNITVSHYLFPIDDVDGIDEASDLAHFDEATGEYEVYPEVKFVKAHTVDFTLNQDTTPNGGRFIFSADFAGGADLVKNDKISLSADHIAVRKIEYDSDNQQIIVSFLRGKMPDQTHGKPDVLRLNLENPAVSGPINISVRLESLNYDLGDPENMVKYTPVDEFTDSLELKQKPFLSLPCLVMKFRLHRGNNSDESFFQKYEYFEPFVRYGVYIQELLKHRTVYAFTENHPVTDPGLVLRNGGFSTFSNIGSSSIPFREYLQTGVRQTIPSAPETSRVDYQDIWKRQWATPIRTVLPDVPPIPPPLRNFVVNTTFEIRDDATGERQLEWNSRHNAELLLKVKLLNNYPKYFEPTVCKDNEFLLRAAGNNATSCLAEKQFIDPDPEQIANDETRDDLYLRRSNSARYGVCYATEGDMVSNQVLTDEQREKIRICQIEGDCTDEMAGIPTISQRPDEETGNWNFSYEVENYFPQNYISEKMWSLTHYDYDDNAFSKGYPYHMDNLLPNMDNVRKGILRPHNIIAQPIFKGLGYSVLYDRNYQSKFFEVEGHKIIGWRSDNLQNKDDTLLGGQDSINLISVDKTDLMAERWIEISGLSDASPYPADAKTNIYACLFNRWRAKVDPQNGKIIYAPNVCRNNVIPILPELDKNDPDLTAYSCGMEYYIPEDIHKVDNVVRTDAKDWLYFGAALRGGAKETINIVSRLSPISGTRFEGFAKINDGARFVYWNPANGPNSFLVLDNVVNVIEALQSRISVSKEIIPVEVPTFNADVYHLITISDWRENRRQFTESPFLKHYGFGDSTTSVQVGSAQNLGARGSILEPNGETTIKIELFNNSGYDWNLIKSADGTMAIESNELNPEAINANDLLHGIKHAIREPTKFNFLRFEIPAEIQNYVEIIPSTHNINVAGILFDFENINVTCIRDGYKGSYFVDMKLKADFPDSLRGKTFDIGISLVPELFDKFPGHPSNDPVAHNYVLQVPSIRFGVPYGSDQGSLSGKVFRTSGYSSEISFVDEFTADVLPMEMKRISCNELQNFRQTASDPNTQQQDLIELYNNIGSVFQFSRTVIDNDKTQVSVDFAENGITKFPIPQENEPDQSSIYLLVHSHSDHLSFGENIVNQNLTGNYLDFSSHPYTSRISQPQYRKVRASGADLEATYSYELIGEATGEKLAVQALSQTKENLIKVTVKITNAGSFIAYYPSVEIYVPSDVEVEEQAGIKVTRNQTCQVIQITLSNDIAPGDIYLVPIVLRYKHQETTSLMDLFISNAYAQDEAQIIDHVESEFDLTQNEGENRVSQETAGPLFLPFADGNNPSVDISVRKISLNNYQIEITAEAIEEPFFQLFVRVPGESEFTLVVDDYFSDNIFNLSIEADQFEIYCALYKKMLVVNEFGEEVYQYTKVAESTIKQYGPDLMVPAMDLWGMLIFSVLAGMAAIYYLRRSQTI